MNFIEAPKQKLLDYFKDKNIAVVYGGMSEEREISLRSGKNIYNALISFDEIKDNIYLIDVKDGYSFVEEIKKYKIDYCYNILHGTYGEDGKMQGLLDMLNIKYTGEGTTVSAICMDKIQTKIIWNSSNIANADFDLLDKKIDIDNEGISFLSNKNIKYPFVIKPIENGSSVGVHIVKSRADCEKIFQEIDNPKDYFVEKYIKGKEYTAGIIPKLDSDKYIFPILGIIPKNDIYDYEAKYTKGMTDFEIPAKIEKHIETKVLDMVSKAYEVLNAKGLCRIDFIIDDKDDVYLLECNTQPGMTETSDVPEMAKYLNIDFKDLVLYILGLSI